MQAKSGDPFGKLTPFGARRLDDTVCQAHEHPLRPAEECVQESGTGLVDIDRAAAHDLLGGGAVDFGLILRR